MGVTFDEHEIKDCIFAFKDFEGAKFCKTYYGRTNNNSFLKKAFFFETTFSLRPLALFDIKNQEIRVLPKFLIN